MRPSRTLPRSRMTLGSGNAPDLDDIEKLEAIRDVMDYAVRVTQQTALAKPMQSVRPRPIALAILALLSLSVAVYALTSEPDWVYGPSPVAAVDQRDAHTRYAMFLAAQRIEASRDSAGTPPPSLAAIGEDWSGFEYRVHGLGVYELRGRTVEGEEILYKSGEDLMAFLGDARTWLREQQP